MFQSLVDFATRSEWVYLLVGAIAALDAVFPVVPSEATVITAAALAASGRLSLALVLAAAAAGAFVGDNAAYAAGRLSSPALRRVTRSPRARRGMEWAERGLARRGATIVVVSRFVPGGRTGTMLLAGATRFRWRRFLVLDLAAGLCWAAYGCALGALGGLAFADRPLVAIAVALALAVVLAALLEGGRRLSRRGRLRETRSARGTGPDAGDSPGA